MQNTTHYNLKKPDYTDFADIQDINDNMDTIDEELAAPTGDGRDQTVSFTDADLDSGITSFPTFLAKIVSGMKLAKFLRDFKAGMAYVLHVGSLVNNATCTESGKALDARMGKTLQDQITSLNDSLTWKQLGYSQNINNVYSLPASFTEIYFRVHTRNVASGVYKYAFHLIRSELTSEGNTFYVVGFNNGSKNQCIISASTSQISVNTFVFNNASDLFGESRLWYR